MDCDTARDLAIDGLAAGRSMPDDVTAHVRGCRGCREELRSLEEASAALVALPLSTPPPAVRRRLTQRIRRESARRALVSLESWQRAAFTGVSAFVLALVLSLVLPFETMVDACRALARGALPTPATGLLAGLIYGVLPMIGGMALGWPRTGASGAVSALEAAVVFMVVLTPYVLLRCGEFPLPLLAGFIAGIALGASGGSTIGVGLRHRLSWT